MKTIEDVLSDIIVIKIWKDIKRSIREFELKARKNGTAIAKLARKAGNAGLHQ